MNTVSGQELVDRLNELSNKAKKRLWIASPYLGEFNAIQRILGSETLCNFNLDFNYLLIIASMETAIMIQ